MTMCQKKKVAYYQKEQAKMQKKAEDKQVGGDHYKSLPIQPIHYIRKNNLGWFEGNIVKYITRHASKGGRKDIEKVIHYAELLLEEYDERTTDNVATSDSKSDSFRSVRKD